MIRNAHPLPRMTCQPAGWVQEEIDAQILIATRAEAMELIAALVWNDVWFVSEPYPDELWFLAVQDSPDLPPEWRLAFLEATQEEAPAILGPQLVEKGACQ